MLNHLNNLAVNTMPYELVDAGKQEDLKDDSNGR
jgi:hypothetical protein